MDAGQQKLIAWLMGELPADEAASVEAALASSPELRAERRRLERTLQVVHAVPSVDVSAAAVARLLSAAAELEAEPAPAGKVISIGWLRPAALSRVAAVAVVAFVFGLGVWITPGDVPDTVAVVVDDSGRRSIVDGESIESRAGVMRRIVFPTGEVLLDGASAVRVNGSGRNNPPALEVERGRVVVTAGARALEVSVAGRQVELERGSVLAVSYDRAYANIAQDGSIVEIQRMPIGDVAALAEEAYGIKLDAALVPESVRNRRVTFYGRNLSADAFVDSLLDASAPYGVTIDRTRRFLGYTPRLGRSVPNEAWQLDVTVLEGRARFSAAETRVALASDRGLPNSVSVSAAAPDAARQLTLDEDGLAGAVVWAAGSHSPAAGRLFGVQRSEESLPGANVIHADKLVLLGADGNRIFKLDGPEFNFPLPGERRGRLVQLTSSGAVFEVQGQVTREFVPFGASK